MSVANGTCDIESLSRMVDEYPFLLPTSVPMAYNGVWGPQNGECCPHGPGEDFC